MDIVEHEQYPCSLLEIRNMMTSKQTSYCDTNACQSAIQYPQMDCPWFQTFVVYDNPEEHIYQSQSHVTVPNKNCTNRIPRPTWIIWSIPQYTSLEQM